jgi:uncharacterized protein YecT (DUF1311 family)
LAARSANVVVKKNSLPGLIAATRKRWAVTLAGGIVAVILSLALPAHAITCSRASNTVERLICSDTQLRRADAAMGRAYTEIVNATSDADIRQMLVMSQKRWLKQRNLRLADIFDSDGTDQAPSKSALIGNLLAAMQDRTNTLTARFKSDPKVPSLIAIALQQRKFAAQYTGGPFAGYDTDCDFFPGGPSDSGPYSYSCFSRKVYQNKNRVCSSEASWATYRIYENDEIADVVDGKLKTLATCSVSDGNCPSDDDSSGDWNVKPGQKAEAESVPGPSPQQTLPKIDGDAGPDENPAWLHACLTDSAYPRSPISAADSAAKPN